MNPWFILAALLAIGMSYLGGHHQGYEAGANAQLVEDQKRIDAANARTQGIIDGYTKQLADQKAVANQKAIGQRDQVIALQADNDKFKKRLGDANVKNQDLTNRLRDAYAAYGLRFKPDIGAGRGDSAGSGEGSQAGSACDAPPAFVQLPDAIARNLRQLVYDADQLNDDYKLCYGYAQQVGGLSP